MKLSSLTYLAFETNAVLDEAPDFELSFPEIHEAAERSRLVTTLALLFGDRADLSLLTSAPDELAQVEAALTAAAGGLYGRERRKTGVAKNGLCLVIAIILEAIQQNFIPVPQPPPEPDLATPTNAI